MRHRSSPLIAGSALLAGLAFGLMLGQPTSGQRAAPAPGFPLAAGRYQVAVGGQIPVVVVIDSATGDCWRSDGSGTEWQKYPSPVAVGR